MRTRRVRMIGKNGDFGGWGAGMMGGAAGVGIVGIG